jgi:hypothetical protein
MALFIRKSEIEPTVLPKMAKFEWDLTSTLETIPEWQWLAMLNYEYARCYKPVVDTVKLLKSKDSNLLPNQVPPYARYLVRQFPEFPKTSWSQILPEARIERLDRFGVTEDTKFYFTGPAWQSWGLFDSEALTLQEELSDSKALNYGVFKLDFAQTDKAIINQFSAWLQLHRTKLLNQSKENYQSEAAKLPAHLRPLAARVYKASKLDKKNPAVVGKGHKKLKCRDYLKALGGLRALQYWKTDEEAEIYTALEQVGGNNVRPIYAGSHSWDRARTRSSEMLMRLAIAWKRFSLPFDPFKTQKSEGFNYPKELRKQLSTSENISRSRENKVTKFLARSFTIDHLEIS